MQSKKITIKDQRGATKSVFEPKLTLPARKLLLGDGSCNCSARDTYIVIVGATSLSFAVRKVLVSLED